MTQRKSPIAMSAAEFRRLGHALVDDLAEFLDALPDLPVTPGEPPSVVRAALPDNRLPEEGSEPGQLLDEATKLLVEHSLFNGHPRFAGYVTSPAAPIGSLAELLASTVNANVGAWILAPMATEIEMQAIRWIAQLIGYPDTAGGVLVSGGSMANFVGFLVARHTRADWAIRERGLHATGSRALRVYASREVHTWLHKAADLFGLGTENIRWIDVNADRTVNLKGLRDALEHDRRAGELPFLVVGSAGTVSTGAVDPIEDLRELCDEYGAWLHIDGAYGALAAASPDCPEPLTHLEQADSLALDPHKWLYAPLEAGCALVRDAEAMRATFSYRPPYYKMDEVGGEPTVDLIDYSPQNSRGFRALKVWLAIRQVGRQGYSQMISDDMRLARMLYEAAASQDELEAFTHNLSITTFRYVPRDLSATPEAREAYLNELNESLLTTLQESGRVFLSNAVVDGRYLLRACIVNFRTDADDIEAIVDAVIAAGRERHELLGDKMNTARS
jgi:glutamate/tyrosine decarboxylase-like PLP-dependent enzyme